MLRKLRLRQKNVFFNKKTCTFFNKSPDLEKPKILNIHLLPNYYLNINKLRNKLIDLREVMSYISPDYLASSLQNEIRQ